MNKEELIQFYKDELETLNTRYNEANTDMVANMIHTDKHRVREIIEALENLTIPVVVNSVCPYCGSTKVIAWGEDADKCEDCTLTWDVQGKLFTTVWVWHVIFWINNTKLKYNDQKRGNNTNNARKRKP